MKELMARRLATGISTIPDMVSPWQNSDSSIPPNPPAWPPKDSFFPDIESNEIFRCENQNFPKYVVDSPVIIDINGCRLTTDGRRPQCAIQPTGQPCPPNCNCALQVDREERKYRPWSDMEKSIFLDKFLQYPKNFSKIAAFLTNRTTKDCIKFYYDSKTTIPYKSLLREFDNRKRHLRNSWTHSCAAAVSVGGLLYPPEGVDDKEHIAELPYDDVTYSTLCSHPMYMATALGFEGSDETEKGNYRRQQQGYLLNRPPRDSTQVKSLRRELKRECFKAFSANHGNPTIWAPPYYGDIDSGGVPKKFTYPSDIRKVPEDGNHYGGYGQNDGKGLTHEGNNSKSVIRRVKEGSVAQKEPNSCLLRDNDRGRGRGGKRGRRPNNAGRGGGKVSPIEVAESKKPEIPLRGRGRGRGRWANRPGRGRGRGKNEDDQLSPLADKDDNDNDLCPDQEDDGEVEGDTPTGPDDLIDDVDLEVNENDEADCPESEINQEDDMYRNVENVIEMNPNPLQRNSPEPDTTMDVVDPLDQPSTSSDLPPVIPSFETELSDTTHHTTVISELVEEIIDSSLIFDGLNAKESFESEIQIESVVLDSSIYEDPSSQVEECLKNIIHHTIQIASIPNSINFIDDTPNPRIEILDVTESSTNPLTNEKKRKFNDVEEESFSDPNHDNPDPPRIKKCVGVAEE
jgi:hypothetical protein